MTFISISHNSMPFMLDLVARGLRLRSNEAIHIIWMAHIDSQNLTVRISTVWVRHIEWCALFLIRWFHSQFKTVNVHRVMRISVFGKDSAYPILVSEKMASDRTEVATDGRPVFFLQFNYFYRNFLPIWYLNINRKLSRHTNHGRIVSRLESSVEEIVPRILYTTGNNILQMHQFQ